MVWSASRSVWGAVRSHGAPGVADDDSPDGVLVAVGFAAATGVFFGFYPARKAAHVNPIDALRFE